MNALRKTITIIAISGNLLFVFWILYNGISEGFKGTLPEIVSYLSLMGLLVLNSLLLGLKTKG